MNIRTLALAALALTACDADLDGAETASQTHSLETSRAGIIVQRVASDDVASAWSRFVADIPELADGRGEIGAMAGTDVLFVGVNTRAGSAVYRSDREAPIARFDAAWVEAIAVGDLDRNGAEEAYLGLDTPLGVTVRRSARGLDAGAEIMRPDSRRALRGLTIGDTDGDGRQELVAAFATEAGGALSVSDGRSLAGYVWGPHGGVAIDAVALRSTGRDLRDELFLGVQTRAGAELWRGTPARPNTAVAVAARLGAAYTALSVAPGRGGDVLYAALETSRGSEITAGDGRTAERLNPTRAAASVVDIAAGPALLVAFDADPGCGGVVGINPEPKDHGCINPEPKGVNPEPKDHVGINPEPKVHGFGINPEPKQHR